MKLQSLVSSGLALGGAALLLAPAETSYGFTTLPTSLGTGNRDVRAFDNFSDAASHNNTTPDPQFPGQTNAELAIWKGIVEWGSGPHGTGTGDPTQAVLGSGGANFDGAWMGRTEALGGANDNIVSANNACPGGVISSTEQPSSDGWRIRLCDNGRIWADGPAAILGTEFDIQGAVCHEYGHALGLGHSTDTTATMFATIAAGETDKRSLEQDDIDGVQFVYGVKSPGKPTITSLSVSGTAQAFTIVIFGMNFTPTNNDVWITHRATTNPGADPRVRVNNLTSTNGGTKITVLLQGNSQAGSGDVLVKISGQGNDKLSNAFPWTHP